MTSFTQYCHSGFWLVVASMVISMVICPKPVGHTPDSTLEEIYHQLHCKETSRCVLRLTLQLLVVLYLDFVNVIEGTR